MMRHGVVFVACMVLAATSAAAGQFKQADWAKCESGDPAGRVAACQAVIKAGAETGRLVAAYMNRGSAARQLHQEDVAIASFTEALKLDPGLAQAYVARGFGYLVTKEYDKAIADFDEGLRLRPGMPYVVCTRGATYLEKKDYGPALADLNACVAQNPSMPESYLNRGIAYERANQFERAIADYDQALQLKPNWIEAIGGRAGAFRKSGQWEQAISDYDKYISLNPNEPAAFHGRGFVKMMKGDFSGAAADYGRYLEMAPSSSANVPYAALWVHLAKERLGQDDTANLAAEAAKLGLTKWPAPVVKFYLGQMTAAEMRAAAADPDAEKAKGQVCEADFYEGERALWRGETAAAVPLLLAARDGCPAGFNEYDAAVAELGRLAKK